MNEMILLSAAGAEGGAGALTGLGTVFSQFATWMGEIVETMTAQGNEIMLIPLGLFVVGGAIGLASRLIGR